MNPENPVGPHSLDLYWDAPADNVDGSPLADLSGYRIYDGSEPGVYTSVTEVGAVTAYTMRYLPAGTYYVSVTAVDATGNESDFSNEVVATLP